MPTVEPRVQALVDELVTARDAFMAALDEIDPALLTSPGLVGVWSARELLAHLGYWAGHAGEAIHHASQDRLDEFEVDVPSVDERNAVVARVAGETTLKTVQSREEQAFEALRERVLEIDPEWLDEHDAGGDTLEEIVRDDGADHYREHTSDIRAWFAAGAEAEDD
jgi:hypothetical protein